MGSACTRLSSIPWLGHFYKDERMKHLRQYIRQILLTEAAKSIEDLPLDTYIGIDDMEDEIMIFFCDAEGNSKRIGNINIELPPRSAGPCNGAYLVTWVEAVPGFGPLLYDLAIEYASRKGGGLTADRKTVQDEAIKVWNYYAASRTDVESIQLDAFEDGTQKSCRMKAAKKDNPIWKQSALSKVWKKSDETLQKLENSQPSRIIYVE